VEFWFCGNEPVEGLPYCAGHARIAYRPAPRIGAPGLADRLRQRSQPGQGGYQYSGHEGHIAPAAHEK
jgi:hypothetical protein